MKTIYVQTRILLLVSLLAVLLTTTLTARADGSGYTLDWWTVDSGGAMSPTGNNDYSLGGTIGQPDARVWTDGDYTLTGGFWVSGVTVVEDYNIYLPLVLRNFSGVSP